VQLTYRLREANIAARLAFARGKRSMKSQMREANRNGAKFVLVIGESEVADDTVTVRPLEGGEQVTIPSAEIVEWLQG
jgi:histidyl-tRNA synthetase